MKKHIYLPFLVICTILACAFATNTKNESNEGINFKEISLKKGVELAKKENKLVFVYFHASWCGPCRLMKKETFSDKEVGDFYNKNFINISVDSEKNEGPSLTKKYGVFSIPYFLILNSKMEVVEKTYGFYNANDFIAIGKKNIKPRETE